METELILPPVLLLRASPPISARSCRDDQTNVRFFVPSEYRNADRNLGTESIRIVFHRIPKAGSSSLTVFGSQQNRETPSGLESAMCLHRPGGTRRATSLRACRTRAPRFNVALSHLADHSFRFRWLDKIANESNQTARKLFDLDRFFARFSSIEMLSVKDGKKVIRYETIPPPFFYCTIMYVTKRLIVTNMNRAFNLALCY